MTKLTIYIAGPMRGIALYNFPAFDAAAEKLRDNGHTVISPAELDINIGFDPSDLPPDFDWGTVPDHFDLEECLMRDVEAVCHADAIYLLTGWEDSSGARMEKAVAEFLGLKVIYQDEPVVETEPAVMPKGETAAAVRVFGALLPTDSAERKTYPMFSGLLAYFPDALAAISHLSYKGNEKHNPGEPLHWSRDKSSDHRDCLMRHLTEDRPVEMAWRALAVLQLYLEGKRK